MESVESEGVEFPYARKNLIYYTRKLADPQIGELWAGSKNTKNPSHNIDYIINFDFDDNTFADDVYEYVGLVLRGNVEAEALKLLMDSLSKLFKKYDFDISDDESVNTVEWIDIAKYARQLLVILEGEKAGS